MKEYLDVGFETKGIEEDGTFVGYGSDFKKEPDSYNDIIARGAFAESISKGGRNGFGVAMLYQHDSKQIPGVWTEIEENARGLKVKGKLALDTTLGKDLHSLMKMEPPAIRGLSIGYEAKEAETDPKTKIRTLKKIDLWEISLVTFPANTRAQITGVKNFEDAKTLREFEAALRDAGLSRKEAVYITSLCKDSFNFKNAFPDALKELRRETFSCGMLETIQSARATLQQGGLLWLE